MGTEPATEAAEVATRLTTMRSDYNQESRGQNQSLQLFKPFIDLAVTAHSAGPSDGPFIVADFGCSAGLNSSEAVSYVIARLREKYGHSSRCSNVTVVLNDLPLNDWLQLVSFVQFDDRSFLREHRGVFALSSGQNFYEQVLPDRSLQLGISSASLHWCSRLPTEMSDHCISLFASKAERRIFQRQAASDLASFMRARSRELVSGGVLAVNFLTSKDDGDHTYQEIYSAALALRDRGVIDDGELRRFNVRLCFRSLEEASDPALYAPFGLELLTAEKFRPVQSIFYQDYLVHRDLGRFAREFSNTVSAFIEPSFVSALSPDRSDTDKAAVCVELWKKYQARIIANPEKFVYSWRLIGVVVRKL